MNEEKQKTLTVNLGVVGAAVEEDADLVSVVDLVVVDLHVVAALRSDDTCKQQQQQKNKDKQ